MSQQVNRRGDVMFRAFAMESVGYVKFSGRFISKALKTVFTAFLQSRPTRKRKFTSSQDFSLEKALNNVSLFYKTACLQNCRGDLA